MANFLDKITSNTLYQKIPWSKLMAFAALVILYLFFAYFGRYFVSVPTTLRILASSYFVGFLAIGVTFVIITGGIDLSIGAVMITSSLVGAQLYRIHEWPLEAAIVVIMLTGMAFGLANGLMVTKLKLPPFIATLGTMLVALGLGSIVTNVRTLRFPTGIGEDAWFRTLFLRTDNNFPSGAVFLAGYFIIAFILLNKTKFGRYVYAIGSNEEAARLSGVNTDKWKCLAFVFCGFSAGCAAIFFAAAYVTVVPNTGQGFELEAIAAVVIGGTSLAGGIGSLTGTMIGVFIMSTLGAGLVSMGIPAPFQVFFSGLVVIGAVLLDIQRTKRANQVKKVK